MSDEQILLDTGPSPRGWHRLQHFLECPQKFAWRYILNERDTTERAALMLGSLVHVGLAHHYAILRAIQRKEDPAAYFGVFEAIKECANRHGGEWGEHAGHATDIVSAYLRHYSFERVVPLHIEELIQASFGGFPYTARVDMIWENTNGRVFFVDHKTTFRIERKHSLFYSVSGQLIAYTWLGKLLFPDRFGGVVVNLIQTGTPFKFERVQLEPAPALHAQFPQTVIDAESGIQRLLDAGRDPHSWPRAMNEHTCFGRYGACEHIDRCKWGNARNTESADVINLTPE